MKRFRFTLEAVLKVKRSLEEKAQKEFSSALAEKNKALMQKGRLENSLSELNGFQSAALGRGGRIKKEEQQLFQERHQGLTLMIMSQKKLIKELEEKVEQKRKVFFEAAKERKVLEKLEDNQYRMFLEKMNREEQGFLDELAQHQTAKERALVLSKPVS